MNQISDQLVGFVEFVGSAFGADGLFVGGWIASWTKIDFENVKAQCHFGNLTLDEPIYITYYPRPDIEGIGQGFLIVFKSKFNELGSIDKITFTSLGKSFDLLPTIDLMNLDQQAVGDQLEYVLACLGNDQSAETLKELIFGRAAFDHIILRDKYIVVEGWVLGFTQEVLLNIDDTNAPIAVHFFRRPDVEQAFTIPGAKVFGFIAIFDCPVQPALLRLNYGFSQPLFEVALPKVEATNEVLEDFARRNVLRLGLVFTLMHASAVWTIATLKHIAHAGPSDTNAVGHLEEAKGVPSIGGHVVGWSVCDPSWTLLLACSQGVSRPLHDACRWHRGDVAELYGPKFGSLTFESGFIAAVLGPIRIDGTVRLIAVKDELAVWLSEIAWQAGPNDPASYARWAFSFPDPLSGFKRRYVHHDSPIIDQLLTRRNEAIRKIGTEVRTFGVPPVSPSVTLIIPIYGRFDFVQHQLLAFADDEHIRRDAEIIYVVDDPRLQANIQELCVLAFKAYQVPFKLLLSPVNRGFAAATNLGAAAAHAPYILLLNSDVIPQAPGWLARMCDVLDGSAQIGVVGARLHAVNGTIQHDGMSFEWNDSWGVHLNKHPGSGYQPPAPSGNPPSRVAVTAACALVRRDLYDSVGGLDEGFLIGDFEDSDFCLKVAALGLQIVCVQDVDLVHLERQSFSGIGANRFREALARFNALRHEERWGTTIKSILEQDSGAGRNGYA